MSVILTTLLLSALMPYSAQSSECSYNLGDYIKTALNFDIQITPKVHRRHGKFSLIAEVRWDSTFEESTRYLEKNKGGLLHGYAVHFLDQETKNRKSADARPIYPLDTCASDSSHMWIKKNISWWGKCDTSASPCKNKATSDFCLCTLPDCIVPRRACWNVTTLLESEFNYHYTVLPNVKVLRFPIDFGKAYEFSLSPYAWDYADFTPVTKVLPPVDMCDESFYDSTQDEKGRNYCKDLPMLNHFLGVSDIDVYFTPTGGNKDIVSKHFVIGDNSSNSVKVCGLDRCKNYTFSLFIYATSFLQEDDKVRNYCEDLPMLHDFLGVYRIEVFFVPKDGKGDIVFRIFAVGDNSSKSVQVCGLDRRQNYTLSLLVDGSMPKASLTPSNISPTVFSSPARSSTTRHSTISSTSTTRSITVRNSVVASTTTAISSSTSSSTSTTLGTSLLSLHHFITCILFLSMKLLCK